MAIGSAAVTVATTAILLSAADTDNVSGQTLYITNGAAVVYLGPAGVTTATGFALAIDTSFPWPIELGSGEALYAISASSSSVKVLRTGV